MANHACRPQPPPPAALTADPPRLAGGRRDQLRHHRCTGKRGRQVCGQRCGALSPHGVDHVHRHRALPSRVALCGARARLAVRRAGRGRRHFLHPLGRVRSATASRTDGARATHLWAARPQFELLRSRGGEVTVAEKPAALAITECGARGLDPDGHLGCRHHRAADLTPRRPRGVGQAAEEAIRAAIRLGVIVPTRYCRCGHSIAAR
eukprot:6499233-Prymnesium_polylepis.2